MENNLIIMEYQENFADNLSSVAYGKILEKFSNKRCFWENSTEKRQKFENLMHNFNFDYEYISTNRVKKIAQSANKLNKLYIDGKKFDKELKEKNAKNRFLNLRRFNIDDIKYLSCDIKKYLDFKDKSFIKSHDILEKITNQNSIGLYINKKDFENNAIDFEFIKNALKRLNKYIKRPKLFVFASFEIKRYFDFDIDFEVLTLKDFREEFHFLKSCRHNIIINSQNSYSEGFWAAVLYAKDWSYCIYDKRISTKIKPKNWIGI